MARGVVLGRGAVTTRGGASSSWMSRLRSGMASFSAVAPSCGNTDLASRQSRQPSRQTSESGPMRPSEIHARMTSGVLGPNCPPWGGRMYHTTSGASANGSDIFGAAGGAKILVASSGVMPLTIGPGLSDGELGPFGSPTIANARSSSGMDAGGAGDSGALTTGGAVEAEGRGTDPPGLFAVADGDCFLGCLFRSVCVGEGDDLFFLRAALLSAELGRVLSRGISTPMPH